MTCHCVHTLSPRGNRERPEFGIFFKIFEITQYLINTLYILDQTSLVLSLEYYVHQFDNAVDFVTLGGLDKVVLPSLNSSLEDLQESAGKKAKDMRKHMYTDFMTHQNSFVRPRIIGGFAVRFSGGQCSSEQPEGSGCLS